MVYTIVTKTGDTFLASFVGPGMRAQHNGQLVVVMSGATANSGRLITDHLERVLELNIREHGQTMDITVHWAFKENARVPPYGAKERLIGRKRDKELEKMGLQHHTPLEPGATSEERIISTLRKMVVQLND